MKLFKKDDLFIPLVQKPEEPKSYAKWIPRIGGGAFILLVIISIFFVNGSILPTKSDTTYQTSKEILLPMVVVSSLNPLISKDEDTYNISKLIYDSLFAMDETMSAQPQLADRYKVDNGSKSITVTLKNGVKWHDGKSLTASDVAYTIEAFKAAGDKSVYAGDISAISSFSVLSASKIKIYFSSANNMGMDLLLFPILPKHQFSGVAEAVDKADGFHPIGTGRYKFRKYDATKELNLAAFSGYYGDKATNKITFRVLPNKTSFYNLLKASNLSLIVSGSSVRNAEFSGEDVTIKDFPSNQAEYLGFNFNQKDLANRSVRKAIAYALKPQDIIDECYSASGMTSENIYYPDYLGVKALKNPYKYDDAESTRLLKLGGYKDSNGDGYLENAGGEAFSLNIVVNENNHARVLAAKLIDRSLKDVGLHCTVTKLPWDAYLSALKSGNFDLYLGGVKESTAMDFRDWLNGDGVNNFTGYNNDQLDDLLDRLRSGETPAEMKKTYGDIKQILHDDLPYFCLLYKTDGAISSPALVGEIHSTFADFYRGCGSWYCRYDVTQNTDTTSQ